MLRHTLSLVFTRWELQTIVLIYTSWGIYLSSVTLIQLVAVENMFTSWLSHKYTFRHGCKGNWAFSIITKYCIHISFLIDTLFLEFVRRGLPRCKFYSHRIPKSTVNASDRLHNFYQTFTRYFLYCQWPWSIVDGLDMCLQLDCNCVNSLFDSCQEYFQMQCRC